jgi:hypothetical protein
METETNGVLLGVNFNLAASAKNPKREKQDYNSINAMPDCFRCKSGTSSRLLSGATKARAANCGAGRVWVRDDHSSYTCSFIASPDVRCIVTVRSGRGKVVHVCQ